MAKFDKSKIADPSDPRPVEVDTGLKRPETTEERIKRIIRQEISPRAESMGEESLEESEDLEIEDEFGSELPITDSEFQEMRQEFPEQMDKLFPSSSPVEAEANGEDSDEGGAPDPGPTPGKEDENARQNIENAADSSSHVSDR